MKKILFILIYFFIITLSNPIHASFPIVEGSSNVSLFPLSDGTKSLLWAIAGFFLFPLVFPAILAIRYGLFGWNDRDSTKSRIGFYIGIFDLILFVIGVIAVLGAMVLASAYGGMH